MTDTAGHQASTAWPPSHAQKPGSCMYQRDDAAGTADDVLGVLAHGQSAASVLEKCRAARTQGRMPTRASS